jgi:ATPase subunit of ABC transporter with duplicated ATPase domains
VLGSTRSITVPSLHLRGVSYAHSAAATILTDVDLDLDVADPAWAGVVGPNGAGKTTLLRLVAGELVPTAGHLDIEAGLAPLLVPQSVQTLTDDVRTFAWRWDGVAQRLRSRLALEPDDPDGLEGRWQTLSPGQRKRWQLAGALAQDPDVLLLDEPTNHLDVEARQLVVEVLAGFRGLGLIVSHDRAVLDRLTGRTLRLHRGGVDLHAGAYSDASARWRAEEAALRAEHDRARRELRRQRRILADVRRDRHGAEAGPRRERRLAGASDPDAREAGRKLAQAKAEAALARRVGQMRSRVERAEADLDGLDVRGERGGDVAFRPAQSGRRVVARVVGDVAHAGGGTWLTDVDVALHRGQRVHLTGRNGAGKTTLLRAFAAEVATTDEVLAELPQELDDPRRELDRVRSLDPAMRGRVLGVVALLGVDPDRVLVTDDPSPGEARKLALARLLAGEAGVVILDEPTNHLDLPSIERLQEALDRWPGALLLVTHDERLAAAVCSTTWCVEDGCVHVEDGVLNPG